MGGTGAKGGSEAKRIEARRADGIAEREHGCERPRGRERVSASRRLERGGERKADGEVVKEEKREEERLELEEEML